MSNIEITSLADPTEIKIKWPNSALDNLMEPSAKFNRIEVAARLNWEASSYFSCAGSKFASL